MLDTDEIDKEREAVIDAVVGVRPGLNGWVRVNCPFCVLNGTGRSDKRRSLGVNRSGYYHCFRCATEGRLAQNDRPDWMLQVGSIENEPVNDEDTLCMPSSYEPLWCWPGNTSSALADARAYLSSRVPSVDLWERARIGAALSGDDTGRIIVPVINADGEWLGHIGRDYTGMSLLKYRYPEGMRRGTLFYNERALNIDTEEPCLIVEGAFDTFPFFDCAVAVLGTISEYQVARLVAAKRPVCFVLDGDAYEHAEALAMRLRLEGRVAGHVKLGPKVDPDEVDPVWLLTQAKKSLKEAI